MHICYSHYNCGISVPTTATVTGPSTLATRATTGPASVRPLELISHSCLNYSVSTVSYCGEPCEDHNTCSASWDPNPECAQCVGGACSACDTMPCKSNSDCEADGPCPFCNGTRVCSMLQCGAACGSDDDCNGNDVCLHCGRNGTCVQGSCFKVCDPDNAAATCTDGCTDCMDGGGSEYYCQ